MSDTLTNDKLIEILKKFPSGTPVRVRDTEVTLVAHPIKENNVELTEFIGVPFQPAIPTIIIG